MDKKINPRRPRRSTEEVRRRILDAARELFAKKGYAETTTREIAEQADVMEPILFRHFGSKKGLLELVVAEPLAEFVGRFIRDYHGPDMPPVATRAQVYVESIYDLMVANRPLLLALLSTEYAVTEDTPRLSEILDGLFLRLAKSLQNTWVELGLNKADVDAEADLRVRMTFGLIASTVLLDDWLFAPGRQRPGKAVVVQYLLNYIFGAGYKPSKSW